MQVLLQKILITVIKCYFFGEKPASGQFEGGLGIFFILRLLFFLDTVE